MARNVPANLFFREREASRETQNFPKLKDKDKSHFSKFHTRKLMNVDGILTSRRDQHEGMIFPVIPA